VELLVAVAVFALLYAGVHGLFTATWAGWRRNSERMPLYQVGNALVDSIVRDARLAKNTTGTLVASQETVDGIVYGNDLTLVLNYPSRRNASGRYDQKRITYRNTGDGFTRRIETDQTAGATDPISLTSGYYGVRHWTLTKYVAQFQYERWNEYASYPRVVRFFLCLDRRGTAAWSDGKKFQYKIYGRAWVRRADADVPDAVSY
jgi:type II secretory pathway pseudopilin PulG